MEKVGTRIDHSLAYMEAAFWAQLVREWSISHAYRPDTCNKVDFNDTPRSIALGVSNPLLYLFRA